PPWWPGWSRATTASPRHRFSTSPAAGAPIDELADGQKMNLRTAFALIEAIFEEGRRRNTRPLSAMVLDLGGHQIAGAREDGAGFARLTLAQGKAWGSLSLGFGSRALS